MAEPTFESIFGANALQDLGSITIAKADLPELTADANNTGESLVVAMLLKIQSGLSQENFDTNLDQSIYVDNGFPNFAFRGPDNDQYRVDQLTVNFAKPDTGSAIDPDDY
ncbi:MAG: hypothetical protein WBF90_38780 [Rivularia sp. (in: cyanobacteria)]